MKKKLLIVSLACLLSLSVLTGCGKKSAWENTTFAFFDTFSVFRSYNGEKLEKFNKRCDNISEILYYYHQQFDIYNEYEGVNNLAMLNRLAGEQPIKVDQQLIDFLLFCKEMYYKTNGKVNVMLGAVIHLWHEKRVAYDLDHANASLPDYDALVEASKHTDIESLVIDEVNKTIYINDPLASIDVGAIGKGYATEKAAQYLVDNKVTSYVLSIGGNIRIIGSKILGDSDSWVTGVRDPHSEGYALKISIKDISCVTSGVYERFYTVDGKNYHHVIDAETLYPSAYFDSLTILCKDSGMADALSTALFCSSYEEGLEIIKNFDTEIGVIWIFPDGEIRYTDNVSKIIVD